MAKSDTFNIDDLLRMPDIADSFKNNTIPLYNSDEYDFEKDEIHKEAISIDSLINDINKKQDNDFNNHQPVNNIIEEAQEVKTNVAPPPPPPIINKPNIVDDVINEMEINLQKTVELVEQIQDFDQVLEDTKKYNFDDNFEDTIIDDINEKIDEVLDIQSDNDYYKNIVEEQDIKNGNEYTRIYFNETDIEQQLKKIDNIKATQELNIDNQVEQNIEIDKVNDSLPIKEEIVEEKISFIKKIRIKSKEFNKNLSNVAGFFKFEYLYGKISWIVSIILLMGCITFFGLGAYAIYGLNCSSWLFFPISLVSLFCISYFVFSTIKIKSMKKELKNNGYVITKENSLASITKIYKQLITANYYLNWSAASLYVISGLLILLTFIVCYFINLADRSIPVVNFGDLIINRTNNAPLIVVWSFASVCFLMIFLQLIFNPLNIHRRNQIEVFYGKTLISEEMIEKYRKSANRKGIAIFVVSTIVVSLIVLTVYFVLRKRAKKKAIG